MQNNKNKTNKLIKLWSKRVITLTVSICLGLVGMSLLQIIDLPDMLTIFFGYLLIASAVVYILKSYK